MVARTQARLPILWRCSIINSTSSAEFPGEVADRATRDVHADRVMVMRMVWFAYQQGGVLVTQCGQVPISLVERLADDTDFPVTSEEPAIPQRFHFFSVPLVPQRPLLFGEGLEIDGSQEAAPLVVATADMDRLPTGPTR